jgi:hypothetical protein
MIYALFIIIFLITSIIFLLINRKILIENSSYRIPKPPIIIEKEINKTNNK